MNKKIEKNSLYGSVGQIRDISARNVEIEKLLDTNHTIDDIIKEISFNSTFDVLLSIYRKQLIKYIKENRPDKIYLIDCDELGLI